MLNRNEESRAEGRIDEGVTTTFRGNVGALVEKQHHWHDLFDRGLPAVEFVPGDYDAVIAFNRKSCGIVVAPPGTDPAVIRQLQNELLHLIAQGNTQRPLGGL